MTPENVQQAFKEAIKTNDVTTIMDSLQSDDMDLNFRDVTHDLETPLMLLCHSSVDDQSFTRSLLDVIVARQPDVNLQDALGRTLAMHACIALRHALLEYIVSRDADVTVCDRTGKNVFHYGACSGDDSIMEVLLRHVEAKSCLRVLDFKGYSPLDLARQSKSKTVVKNISQALSGNSQPLSTNQKPLKPLFKLKSSSADKERSTSNYKNIHPDLTMTATAATGRGQKFSLHSSANPRDSIDSQTSDVGSEESESTDGLNTPRGSHADEANSPEGNVHATKNVFTSKSPLPPPRMKNAARVGFGAESRSTTSSYDEYEHSADAGTEEITGNALTGRYESPADPVTDLSPRYSHPRSSPSSESGVLGAANPSHHRPNLSRKQHQNVSGKHQGSSGSSPEQKSLAPLMSSRRKINLDINTSATSLRPKSDGSLQYGSRDGSRSRQIISELKPQHRKPFGTVNVQNPSKHVPPSQVADEPTTYPSRPAMMVPFQKEKEAVADRLNKVKAADSGNMNTHHSPQQPHKHLLFKRQRDIGRDGNEAKASKDSNCKPPDTEDDDAPEGDDSSVFEDEISLESTSLTPNNVSGQGNQGQGQAKGRRSSLSLPDLRDMTGCLVTSARQSPSQVIDSVASNGESPMNYFSDDDDDDDDDAVLEDDSSDECIEDSFDNDIENYSDLIKPRGLHKGNEENVESKATKPLPVINVQAQKKGKSFLKL